MKCISCGAQVQDGTLYCPKCGREAQIVKNIEGFEDEYLIEILGNEHQRQQPSAEEKQRQKAIAAKKKQEALRREQELKKKRQRTTITCTIICVLLIGLAGAGIYAKMYIDNQNAHSFDYQLEQAKAQYASGNTKEAIVYYSNALDLDPSRVDVRLTLAKIYLNRMDFDLALEEYKKVLAVDPDNYDAYADIITIYERRNKTNEILSLMETTTDESILALFDAYRVFAPKVNLPGGNYTDYLQLTLSSTRGDTIYYTLDGSDPVSNGKVYKQPISLSSMDTYRLRAVCMNEKRLFGEQIDETYVIDIPAPNMPEVTPNGGTFTEQQEIVVTVPTACIAYYTWDGSIPDTTSSRYYRPLNMPEGNSILSVMIVDTKTQKASAVYRGRFIYHPADADEEGSVPEEGISDSISEDFSEETFEIPEEE